jgi:hypothetical protein
MKDLFDMNDVILYITTFNDDYFTKSFSPEKIEKAKEKVLQSAFIDSEYFKNLAINKTQFANVCKGYKNKIRNEILNN